MAFRRFGRRFTPTAVAALAPALVGCSVLGGQSSDDSGSGCPFETVALASDETRSSLDFAPRDVLDWALDTHSTTARWQARSSGISTNAPDADTEVTVTLSRREGRATEQTCDTTRVHVPVRLEVTTADGLVELDAPGELDAGRNGFARAQAQFDFDDLTGSFSWQSEAPGVELVQPSIALALTPQGVSGSFAAIRQVRTSDAVVDTPPPLGWLLTWPADTPCAFVEVGVAVADSEPIWTEGPRRASEATWTETGGESDGAPITLALTTATALCESDTEPLRLAATLTLRTEDGVVDQTVNGHVVRTDDGIQFTNEHVRHVDA